MKLYPPVIDNKISAFFGDSITIPFNLNKAVSINNIAGAVLLIKSVDTNKILTNTINHTIANLIDENVVINNQTIFSSLINKEFNKITFYNISQTLNNYKLKIGQYYKIQIAFVNNQNEIGYYSNVGVAKYTYKPNVYIEGFNKEDNIIKSPNYLYKAIVNYEFSNKKAIEAAQSFQQFYTDYQSSDYFSVSIIKNNYLNMRKSCQEYYLNQSNNLKTLIQFTNEGSEFYTVIKELDAVVYSCYLFFRNKEKPTADDFKYTLQIPAVIEKLKYIQNNLGNIMFFTGLQKHIASINTDLSEVIYSYKFNLYNKDKQLIDTSGLILNDVSKNFIDDQNVNTWKTFYNLKPYENYTIEYLATTINGLELQAGPYLISQPDTINLDINADFLAILDYENGCIDISLQPDSKFNSMIKYKFLISRASDKDNYSTWEPLYRDMKAFNFEIEDVPQLHIWTDYTVEHGVSYIYSLQAYNDYDIYSNRIYSNRIKYSEEEKNERMEYFSDLLLNVLASQRSAKKYLEDLQLYEEEKITDDEIKISFNNFKKENANQVSIYDKVANEQSWLELLKTEDNKIITFSGLYSGILYASNNIKKNHLNNLIFIYSSFIRLLQNEIEKWETADTYGDPIPVMVNFEHSYLTDGDRQLKIAFNPKVTSFKNTVLESKVDTIGGQYPFFFRNAKVKYKEFPISGLISCLMDSDNKFLTNVHNIELFQMNLDGTKTVLDRDIGETQLTTTNIYKERNFKIQVLEWLSDGEPKIFRSPTEGNFIVRLMGVSLSPNDTLGRMLHTFSCTAYEIASYTFDNLREYKFVDVDLTLKNKLWYICAKEIGNSPLEFLIAPEYVKCNIIEPHQGEVKIQVQYSGKNNENLLEIIHFQGGYEFPKALCPSLNSITVLEDDITKKIVPISITWAYQSPAPSNNFNYIKKITMQKEFSQFLGGGNIIADNKITTVDIIQDLINNEEREIGIVNYLKIYRKHIEDCWYGKSNNGETGYYQQAMCLTKENFEYADTLIYRVLPGVRLEETFTPYYLLKNPRTGNLVKMNEKIFNESNPYEITLNDETFSLEKNEISADNINLLKILKADKYMENSESDFYFPITTETRIESTTINDIKTLRAGVGLNVEMSYNIKIFEYGIEQSTLNKTNYQNALDNLKTAHKTAQEFININQNITPVQATQKRLLNIQEYRIFYEKYLNSLSLILQDLRNAETENVKEEE